MVALVRRWERRICIFGQIDSRGASRVALSVNTRSTWHMLLGWLLERSSRRESIIGVSCCCEIDMEVGICIGGVVVFGDVVVVVDVVVDVDVDVFVDVDVNESVVGL